MPGHTIRRTSRRFGRRWGRRGGLGKIHWFPALMLALLVGTSGVWLAVNSSDSVDDLQQLQTQLENTLVFPQDYNKIPEFNLLDQYNQPVTSSLFKGKWSLVFFGFTQCPEICPMTLSIVRDAVDAIRADTTQIDPQVVFVSVDPKRDTAEKLNRFLAAFDSEFIGLTGELYALYALTQPLNIVVQFTADRANPESYTVDHTASILLIDPQLRVRGSFKAPHKAETIVSDYSILLQHLGAGSS